MCDCEDRPCCGCDLDAGFNQPLDPFDDLQCEDFYMDEPPEMTDVEADADTLASAGWGTDEDYGGWDVGDWSCDYDGDM